MTFLIDGDDELGNVCDELIALSFPQLLHTDLEVLDQDFLKRATNGIIERDSNSYQHLQYQVITSTNKGLC